jgi:NADH dehydrogenase/NADH:ubiquinone oxidoreductase subunit G
VRGGRAQLPEISGVKKIGIGVFTADESKAFSLILPGLSFTEKDGTVFNFEGREQKIKRAVTPSGDCKPLSEITMMWIHGKKTTGAI